MPNYTYKCTVCNYQFNKIQSFNSEPLKKCPKCNGKLKKIISGGAGVIFKGSGFYVNDYKKRSAPKSENAKNNVKKSDKNSKIKESNAKDNSVKNSKRESK
ncbi:MAG: FmdB family zinc ribbon protein [Candidatus Marinimicrobia bacterium]|nr:FmdB family zinc ribbon protein [Candidatus Neomarinimicrobiota bacterium]